MNNESMPTEPGWYPVTVVDGTGEKTRVIVQLVTSTLGEVVIAYPLLGDSQFTEWGEALRAELEAEGRESRAELILADRTNPENTARLVDWDERLRQVPNVEWTWGEDDGWWYIGACLSPEAIYSVVEIESWRQHEDDDRSRELAYTDRKNYPAFARLVDERNGGFVEPMTSEQIEALPMSQAEGNPNLALEEAARSYVEHLKTEGIDADRAYARVLDRLLSSAYSLTNTHGKTAEWFAAHLVYDTIYAKEIARIEIWIDPEGSPGMFGVDGKSEEQLAFLREGTCKAVFHDMTYPAAKKLYDRMLGHDTEDERRLRGYEGAFARIDHLAGQLEATLNVVPEGLAAERLHDPEFSEVFREQAQLVDRLLKVTRTADLPQGLSTEDERWRKKYEAAFVKIDRLAMAVQASLGFDPSARLLLKQTQLVSDIISATRSEKQPEWDEKFGLDYHQMRKALLEARRYVSKVVRFEHNGPEELLVQIDEALKLRGGEDQG